MMMMSRKCMLVNDAAAKVVEVKARKLRGRKRQSSKHEQRL